MKNILIICSVLLIPLFSYSQKVKVESAKEKVNEKTNDVLTVMIYEVESDKVEREWKSLMKDYKAKNSTSKGEIFSDNATISDMSANVVDVYAVVKSTKEKDNPVKLIVGFNLGGAFVSSSDHPKEFKVAEKILTGFALKIMKEAVEEKVKIATKEQEKRQEKLDDLLKENAKLKKDIENYKNKISQAEKDIETNVKNQEDATKLLEEQKKSVEAVSTKLKDIK